MTPPARIISTSLERASRPDQPVKNISKTLSYKNGTHPHASEYRFPIHTLPIFTAITRSKGASSYKYYIYYTYI